MSKFCQGFKWKFLAIPFLFFFHSLAVASLMLTLEGKVVSMDEKSVVLQNKTTMIKVPRCTVVSKTVRPGEWVSALVDSKEEVTTWAAKQASVGK